MGILTNGQKLFTEFAEVIRDTYGKYLLCEV